MDSVQQAKSGHPGIPMTLAPLKELQKKFGFEPEDVVATAKRQLGKG
jgi:transketolase